MKSSVLIIEGMGCAGCVDTVEDALRKISGVYSVKADLNKGVAEVGYDEQEVMQSDFEKAIEDAGYTMNGTQA